MCGCVDVWMNGSRDRWIDGCDEMGSMRWIDEIVCKWVCAHTYTDLDKSEICLGRMQDCGRGKKKKGKKMTMTGMYQEPWKANRLSSFSPVSCEIPLVTSNPPWRSDYCPRVPLCLVPGGLPRKVTPAHPCGPFQASSGPSVWGIVSFRGRGALEPALGPWRWRWRCPSGLPSLQGCVHRLCT